MYPKVSRRTPHTSGDNVIVAPGNTVDAGVLAGCAVSPDEVSQITRDGACPASSSRAALLVAILGFWEGALVTQRGCQSRRHSIELLYKNSTHSITTHII